MATANQGPPTLDLSDPKIQALKTRVQTHMTTDHADSLALFLTHYCKVPVPLRPTPPPGTLKLDDIALDHIVIAHPTGRNLVQITPPMSHLGQSRERLVGMHNDCLTALDLAPFKVETFVVPNKLWQWITHFVCALCFVTYSVYPAEAFLPEANTLASQVWSIGGLAPGLARLTSYVKDAVLVGMLAIHVTEAAYFSRTRLRKYWVPRFSGVWWMWTTAVFNGGVAAMWRFDEMVESMEVERAKGGKH